MGRRRAWEETEPGKEGGSREEGGSGEEGGPREETELGEIDGVWRRTGDARESGNSKLNIRGYSIYRKEVLL